MATKSHTVKKTCPICGKSFKAKNQKGTFCSSACKNIDYRKRKADKTNNELVTLKKQTKITKIVTRNGKNYVSIRKFKCGVCGKTNVHYAIDSMSSAWFCDDCNAEVFEGIEIK